MNIIKFNANVLNELNMMSSRTAAAAEGFQFSLLKGVNFVHTLTSRCMHSTENVRMQMKGQKRSDKIWNKYVDSKGSDFVWNILNK